MTKPITLTTTQDQFESLHEALHKTRQTSETVKVEREALRRLLVDHAQLLQRVDHRQS